MKKDDPKIKEAPNKSQPNNSTNTLKSYLPKDVLEEIDINDSSKTHSLSKNSRKTQLYHRVFFYYWASFVRDFNFYFCAVYAGHYVSGSSFAHCTFLHREHGYHDFSFNRRSWNFLNDIISLQNIFNRIQRHLQCSCRHDSGFRSSLHVPAHPCLTVHSLSAGFADSTRTRNKIKL